MLPLLLLTMGTVLVTLLLMLSVTLLPTVFVSLTPLLVVILFLLAKEMVTCHHQVLPSFGIISPVLDLAAAANLAAAAGNDGDQELFLRDDGTTSPEPDTDC